jgi:ubiquinone/menaquinone biosynthesis C-methylase UbiE
MTFNENILLRYMSMAPLALAFERTLECQIYQTLPFERPILDVGCGDGLFAKILFAEKIDTGVDPDPQELKRAEQGAMYHELVQAPGHAIPKPDGVYKTIFSNSVLEHIPDIKPVLREVYRLLSVRGNFYMTVPSNHFDRYAVLNRLLMSCHLSGLATRYRNFYNTFWQHYHYYSLEEWEQLVREAGFEVLQSFMYDPKSICTLNDGLVPFGLPAVFLKRWKNRWVYSPALRKKLFYPVYVVARKFLHNGQHTEGREGGLVFISLTKI